MYRGGGCVVLDLRVRVVSPERGDRTPEIQKFHSDFRWPISSPLVNRQGGDLSVTTAVRESAIFCALCELHDRMIRARVLCLLQTAAAAGNFGSFCS